MPSSPHGPNISVQAELAATPSQDGKPIRKRTPFSKQYDWLLSSPTHACAAQLEGGDACPILLPPVRATVAAPGGKEVLYKAQHSPVSVSQATVPQCSSGAWRQGPCLQHTLSHLSSLFGLIVLSWLKESARVASQPLRARVNQPLRPRFKHNSIHTRSHSIC